MAEIQTEAGKTKTEAILKIEYLLCSGHHGKTEFSKDSLTVGSGDSCDIRLPQSEDIFEVHCTLEKQDGRWVLMVPEGHTVYVNDKKVAGTVPLEPGALVFVGKLLGPGFRIRPDSEMGDRPLLAATLRELRDTRSSVMAAAARVAAEKPYQREVIKRGLNRINVRYRKIIRNIAIAFVGFALTAGAVVYHQQVRLNRLHNLAEEIFYQMKEIELQISRAENIIEATGDSSIAEENEKLWRQFKQLEAQYDAYLRELGFGEGTMPEDERIILRMARVFGECEINMPREFVKQVKAYINKWRTTPRYRKAMMRALENGYVQYIAETMLKYHLPPHFMYLAMQESDFDSLRCGPRTRYGIAKGMWQFIPTTAVYFGLKLGPLVEVRRPDPQDERHNVKKSTVAAAKYLKFLYTTEAQASGLLVMASYNWGESKVRRLINKLPENPRERNFWALMKKYKLPRETRDYVFYIFSAAVIGENPRLFGFDLKNPLSELLDREQKQAKKPDAQKIIG